MLHRTETLKLKVNNNTGCGMSCDPCYTADIATFGILFPEFDTVGDATKQFYLDKADCVLSDVNWGCTKPEAQLYYSAHQIALSQNRQANAQAAAGGEVITVGGAGAITSASAGGISVGYGESATSAQGSDADTVFTTTWYGQWYLYLKRTRMPTGLIATC